MELGIIALLFVVGACVGSFVNVIALRYNTGLSFLRGSSVCLSCRKHLPWYELIPIISYLYLRGRCSKCQSTFSLRYLIVEIVSGILTISLYFKVGAVNLEFLVLVLIFEVLISILLYDLKHKIIPDAFVLVFVLLSLIYSYLISHTPLIHILTPAIIIALPFFLIWLLSKGRLMGLGDPKLMFGMGLFLGLSAGISAVFLSFWIGSVYVLILYLYKKLFHKSYNISMQDELPFAPFLVLGTMLTFFFEINLISMNL